MIIIVSRGQNLCIIRFWARTLAIWPASGFLSESEVGAGTMQQQQKTTTTTTTTQGDVLQKAPPIEKKRTIGKPLITPTSRH